MTNKERIANYEQLEQRSKALTKAYCACAFSGDLRAELATRVFLVNEALAKCEQDKHDAQRTS